MAPIPHFPSNAETPTIAPQTGKRYVMRNGQKTGPMQPFDGPSPKYQWMTAERVSEFHTSTWTAEGNFYSSADHVSQYDIVAEWVETDTQPTIPPQAGKTYRMRNGETVGPMRFRDDAEDYPWLGYANTGVARLYQTDGRHHANPAWDIIAEITLDADAPTAEGSKRDYVRGGATDGPFKLFEDGPVRHRTVTEIVPGVYGRVEISPYSATAVTHVGVRFEPMSDSFAALDAAELRAAAAVLIALADGLDEMGGRHG
jgi:hypothetical protein